MVLLGLTKVYRVLPSFTEFYRVWPSFTWLLDCYSVLVAPLMVFTEFYRVFRHFHANRNTHRCFYRVFFLNYHHFFFVYFRFMVWNESFPGGAMVSAAIKEMSHFLLCWLPGFTEFFFSVWPPLSATTHLLAVIAGVVDWRRDWTDWKKNHSFVPGWSSWTPNRSTRSAAPRPRRATRAKTRTPRKFRSTRVTNSHWLVARQWRQRHGRRRTLIGCRFFQWRHQNPTEDDDVTKATANDGRSLAVVFANDVTKGTTNGGRSLAVVFANDVTKGTTNGGRSLAVAFSNDVTQAEARKPVPAAPVPMTSRPEEDGADSDRWLVSLSLRIERSQSGAFGRRRGQRGGPVEPVGPPVGRLGQQFQAKKHLRQGAGAQGRAPTLSRRRLASPLVPPPHFT